MSLIPFGAVPFTTEADRRRRPVITSGQLVRTLGLFAAFVAATACIARNAHALVGAPPSGVTAATPDGADPDSAAFSLPPGSPRGIDAQQ